MFSTRRQLSNVTLFRISYKILKRKDCFTSLHSRNSSKSKFIYSEKATKFCESSSYFCPYVVPVKSKMEISQNVAAFSEYILSLLLFLLKVSFFRKCDVFFKSPKKIFQITILNLKYNFSANNSKQQI